MISETWAADVENCSLYGTTTLYLRHIADIYSWHDALPRNTKNIELGFCPSVPKTDGKIIKLYKVKIEYQPEVLKLIEEHQ